jgi:hypothetical protein
MPVPVITYTIEQYISISEAIATGALKVKYGDKDVEYRSLSEMLRIQQLMYNQLFPQNNCNNGRVYFAASKGINPRYKKRF